MINNTVFTCEPTSMFAKIVSVTNNEMEETKTSETPCALTPTVPYTLAPLDLSLSKNWILDSYKKFGRAGHCRHPNYKGPTNDSNILIPGHLTVGGYPSYVSSVATFRKSGVTHFVCLNTKKEYGNVSDRFPPYANNFRPGEFIHFPIIDMSASAADVELKSLCFRLKDMIMDGKHILVHCAGGHGRTGTLVAILLKILYPKLHMDEIYDYLQYSHDQREGHNFGQGLFTSQITNPILANCFVKGQVPTPQTSDQRTQVERVVKTL